MTDRGPPLTSASCVLPPRPPPHYTAQTTAPRAPELAACPSAAGFCTPLSTTSQTVLLDWPPSLATLLSAHLFLVRVHHNSTLHPGTSLTRFPRRLTFTAPQQSYRRHLAPHTPGWADFVDSAFCLCNTRRLLRQPGSTLTKDDTLRLHDDLPPEPPR